MGPFPKLPEEDDEPDLPDLESDPEVCSNELEEGDRLMYVPLPPGGEEAEAHHQNFSSEASVPDYL